MFEIFLMHFKEEFNRLKEDKKIFLILSLGPLVLILFLGALYWQNVVTNIQVAVLDYDQTSLSRTVINSFADSDKFDIVFTANNQYEIQEAMKTEQIKAAIVIPEDFQKDVRKQKATSVLVAVDGANILYANSALGAANEIIQTINAGAGIKVMEGKGLTPDTAYNIATLISYKSRVWYNPTFSYTNFLLYGLLGVILQQLVVLYGASAIIRDKESGRLAQLNYKFKHLVMYSAGKIAPYGVIEFVAFFFSLIALLNLFHVPYRGSYLSLLILLVLYLLALCGVAVLFSLVARNEKEAIQIAMIFSTPSFFLSGFTWPLQSMPVVLQIMAKIWPLTFFVNPLRRLGLHGVDINYIYSDLIALLVLFLGYFGVSVWVLKVKACKLQTETNFDDTRVMVKASEQV